MPQYTDIPIVEGPTNQQTGEYSFVLPTRFNDDESNVTVVFPSSVSKADALAEIRDSFPRNSADTQVQKMTDPEWYTKISKDDYFQLKADEHKYPGQDVGLGTIAYHAAKDALAGIGYLGKELGTAAVQTVVPGVGDQRMAARHAWNVVEGFMQGNERLAMLAGLLEMKLGDVAMSPLRDSESNTDADFQRFIYAQEMGKTMAARAQGQMITEGGGQSPVFGDTNFKPQFVPNATEADVAAANSIGNVLDVLAVTPVGGALEKAGAAAGGTMFKYVMPTALADTAIKAGFTGVRIAGTALDEASKLVFNQITKLTEAVGEGAVTNAGKAVANYTAKAAMYGGLFTGPGGHLIGASLAGKGMRAIGEIGGAVMTGLEEGGVRASLQALSENELKAATIRTAARMAAAIAPPDAAFSAMKGIVDSMATTGATMGTLNAMSAWASNDDPVKAFAEGMASGAGFGLSFGAMHAPFGMTGQDKVRLANMFDNDIRGRELTKSFNVTQPSGHVETATFNDLQGRIDFYNREDISARAKALTLAVTQGHERAGGTTIFIDSSPESAALMEKIGFGGTKGVHYFDGADGKSTILIDSKSIDSATAVEEVMHGLNTEILRREVMEGMQAGMASEDPYSAVQEVSRFGMRYAAEMEAAGHPERAAEMRDNIAQALDPAIPMDAKLKMLDGVINEYVSNYVGAAVHGMKPDIFLEGNIRNIWDKVWDKTVSNVLSAFDFTKNGLTKDPIKGHFFDERGKRVIMPELEGLVGRFVDAVREGRGEIASKDTVDGAHYVDVRTSKPYSSPEDFVDGRPTTLKQKKEILKSIYEQNIAAASAIDPSLIVIADPATVESGMLGGNVAGLKNKQVLFSRGLPDAFFTHLSTLEVNGKKVYTPDQIEALKGSNEAMKAGHIVMLDAWHDISRTKGNRSDVYYGRTNRPALPVSWQQTETGGLIVNHIDIGRIWSQMRYFAKYEPKLRAELASKDIRTFSDVIPYIQRYFDNYSSGSPKPAAKLTGFSDILRDGISRALDIKNRKAFAAEDAARFANEHTFDTEGFPSQPQPKVTVNGIEREVNRDRVSMQAIRSDRILGLNDFTVDGFNVPIKYDPGLAMNLIRANFAPGSTTREKMPNGEVLTDKVTGNRIVVSKTGKASLYEGDRRSIYGSVDEAIAAADKRSVASFAPRRKKAEEKLPAKIADTMDSLAHKPEASNQSIALAVDKAYQAGEIPLETVHATKAKLAEAVDEDYVAKRYEAIEGVWYHGQPRPSSERFTEFDPAKGAENSFGGWNSFGSWFTKDQIQASNYARYIKGGNIKEGNIYKTELNFDKPLILSNFDQLVKLFEDTTGKKTSNATARDAIKFREHLTGQGYDAVLLPEVKGDSQPGADPVQSYAIALDPAKIKILEEGLRASHPEPTPEEISAVDAKRHDTEVILRDKELKQNRGLTEKQKAMYAERADKQMVRMDEQTNRMLNNARAEALAQGKQAMQRAEQERIVSRRESFIEAFKTQAEAKAEAKKYLEEEASAERKKLAAQRESDTATRQESKKKQAQSIEERKQGFKEALTERDAAKAEAKKYLAEERAAERARIAQEKETADKLAAENKAKRDAALIERKLGFEELLKEKAKSEREYQRDLKKNLDRSEKAQKFHAEERAARAAENAKLAEKEALRVKLRTIENEKHVRAMEELLKAHDTASLGETTAKGTEVVDAKIPHNIRIIITPARRFRVYMPTGSLVGVSDSYKEALKTAQRNAPKKVSVR